jgi:hypothetical protein
VLYGSAPQTVSATGGASGNPVTFTVTGPATLSGSTLTITGAGTVTVTANQAGSIGYSAAPSVSQTIVVNPAAQAITFAPLASPVNYGTTPMALSATGGASGNPVTFKATGPATVSGNILTITGAGTVTVAADQAGNTNYAAAPEVLQTLLVNKIIPAVTVTANPTPVFILNPFNVAATITSSMGTPSGTVTFLAGSTTLGTATITNGVATLQTSMAITGTQTVSAVYNGDMDFMPQTSSPATAVAVDFSVTAVGTPSQDVVHGNTASYSFVVSPVGATALPSDITLSLAEFPQYSVITFSPATIAAGSGTTTVVLTVQVPSFPTQVGSVSHVPQSALAIIALGALLLPFGRKLRIGGKRAGRLLCMMILLTAAGAMAGLTGCGAGWNHEDFTPVVTAHAGPLSHDTVITLTVH